MAKDMKKLIAAFAVKEEVEGFLSNLKKLKADGSITDEQYATAKVEYEQRLNAARLDIERIKNELKKQAEATQQDIETYKFELDKLEAKYKVGELPLEKYQSSHRKLRAKIEGLEQHAEELTRLIKAKSSADIGVTVRKPGMAAPGLPSLPKVTPSLKGIKMPGRTLAIAGGAVVVIAVIAAVILLMAGSVKEVKIPINIQGAANVGALHIELVYDRDILNATAVENGTATGDAMFEHNIDTPGQVLVGIVSSGGIKQDGSVAIVTFKVIRKAKTATQLSLENVLAHDATTLDEIPTTTSAGSFTAKDGSFTPPGLLFGTE